jgi:uncharacterized membrane protein YcaP (DUF421 family)
LFQQALAETPTVLVTDGVVHQRAVRREGLTPDDLEAAVRNHGLASMDEVKRAVLEIDGSISVIPANQPSIRTQPDLLRSRRGESRRFDARN